MKHRAKLLKHWRPHHTVELKDLSALGWTDGRIARRMGFTRQTVQRRRAALGLANCYRAQACADGSNGSISGGPSDAL